MAERMFDGDSFKDEITNASEAKSCADYLAHNERGFRKELMAEGLSHEQEEEAVRQVWKNLLQSCKRVGYSDSLIVEKTERYSK